MFVGLGLGESKAVMEALEKGKLSGPLQACHRRAQPLLLSSGHIYKVRYTTRKPWDTQSTANLPPRVVGMSRVDVEGASSSVPLPIPVSLISFSATQEHSGNPTGAEEDQTPV